MTMDDILFYNNILRVMTSSIVSISDSISKACTEDDTVLYTRGER